MTILNPEKINQVPETIGVYRIYAKNFEHKPILITRFCDTDQNGLLYIGRTIRQNLRMRLYQFYASANVDMNTHNHSGGLKYCNNPIIGQTLGKNHTLYFDYEFNENPKNRESELLKEYVTVYGEYPPLNK